MSTAVETSKSSAASRKRGYIPGAPVRSKKRARTVGDPQPWQFPMDLLDKILECILDAEAGGLSVIKLSMVNRAFRQGVSENLAVWYRLYLQWRGPIRDRASDIRTPRGVVRLRPTVPMSVPNFRVKTPPIT